ncbi:TetR/AcrR family transcriptional regulator [Ensifer adhaerens]|uniref:TetR/AcrR family transcriptional regulator n=1 Tax=Ensifer adhaerens TaxID=106592 RepID=UPI000FDC34B3|nr:TetR/AcrR family transcriptional regulator [Ensifer adhaerens]MDF8357586.1 helix-turn-helix domain containing protein [Ensifer adhaerens]THA61049.1 TetR/AcrR family transcriptional regulator [Ensifer adhaerens]
MAGRPREFDRDVALAKARDAFWSRGYEGVSMADLVEKLGIASARIYAAFGSKRELFQEAVALYDAEEGGFAVRAMAEERTATQAIERSLREAIENCTRKGRPQGCMIVSAATNCSAENEDVREFLAEYRRGRSALLLKRLERAIAEGEVKPEADAQALADHYATILLGIAVQARDGVPRAQLLDTVPMAMLPIQAVAL